MSFFGAIKHVFQNYAVFSGRTSRRVFWFFSLFKGFFQFLFGAFTVIFDEEGYSASDVFFLVLWALFSLATLVPAIAVSWRRLHDTGRSGGRWFMGLIPFAGPVILIVWYCQKSQPFVNQYGPCSAGTDAAVGTGAAVQNNHPAKTAAKNYERANHFEKTYSFDDYYGADYIINKLLDKGYIIKTIHLVEKSDVGEKMYQGDYSVDEYLKLSEDMDRSEITSYGIYLNDDDIDSIICVAGSNLITAFMKNPDAELGPIFDDSFPIRGSENLPSFSKENNNG